MTNLTYVKICLAKFGVTDSEISLLLLEQGIDETAEVNFANTSGMRTLKVAIYKQLPAMMAGLQNITEGGYSITWNTGALTAWLSALANELGLPDPFAPKVKDRSNLW